MAAQVSCITSKGGRADENPISATVLPTKASNGTDSPAAPGWFESRNVLESGWVSPLGMVANIMFAKSAPDVVGSTFKREVPAGDLILRSCRGVSHALREST